jgi:hypothetical protein
VLSSYGLEITESCLTCKMREGTHSGVRSLRILLPFRPSLTSRAHVIPLNCPCPSSSLAPIRLDRVFRNG